MKFVLKTDVAKKLFDIIASGISAEKIATYQSMFCKNIGDGNMYVRAMDKSHVMQLTIEMESEENFTQVYIPFFEINKFLPKFKSQSISFQIVDNNVLKVSSGKSYCKTSLLNVQESPNVVDMLNSQFSFSVDISKNVLSNIKNKLNGLVSVDNNRPVLTGVCLNMQQNGSVQFASSDGKKLAVFYSDVVCENNENSSKSIIIPVSTINTVCSVSKSQNVKVKFNDKIIVFDCQNVKYFSNLISGDYPPYQKIVSSTEKNDKTIVINKNCLVDALSFVNVNFDVNKKCEITFSNNKATVDYDNGANHQEFQVSYDGEFSFLVNSQFLEKMIRPIQAENIIFKFSSPTQAILMQADSMKLILMPLKSNR